MSMSDVETRYIPHDGNPPFATDLERVRKDIEDALVAGVQRVHRHITTKSGVYVGGPGMSAATVASIFLKPRMTS